MRAYLHTTLPCLCTFPPSRFSSPAPMGNTIIFCVTTCIIISLIVESPPMIFQSGFYSLCTVFKKLSASSFCKSVAGPAWDCKFSQMSMMAKNIMPVAVNASKVKYLNQNEAIKIDQDLFNEYKFSVDQLMELAGLSVATAVAKVYEDKKSEKVLIITGPGNNGGDGMVAARHLKLFGFQNITILNARKPTKDLFINLLHQATENDIEVTYDPSPFRNAEAAGLVIDALFGFSFKPPVRPDFQPLMDILISSSRSVPVASVDIPSGWHVEQGPPPEESMRFMPDMLISLTAPKLCATHLTGNYHFLGGRFVPKKLSDAYELNLPEYSGTECVLRLK